MGLDSFWDIPKGSKDVNFSPPLKLCGGMLSAHGEGSFRGKVYDYLIETVTGESLYQEKIAPAVIKKMSLALDNTEYDSLPPHLRTSGSADEAYPVTREEYEDIRRMFSTYAKLGACLKGWW
jgi:hypothetical protein